MTEIDFQDSKLQECKSRIKAWERRFVKEHGRRPSRVDMDADLNMKACWSLYYKLKTALLESRILGDGPALEEKIPASCAKENLEINNPTPTKPKAGVLEITTEGNQQEESVKIVVSENNETPSTNARRKTEPKKWLRNASSKIFEGVSFKMRNPRKGLQRKAQPDGTALSDDNNSAINLDSFSQPSGSPPVLDNSNVNFSIEDEVSPKIKSLISTPTSLSPLLSSSIKINVVNPQQNKDPHPLSLLTMSMKPKTIRKLDTGWLDRCTQIVGKALEDGRVSADSGFESLTGSYTSPTVAEPTAASYSSDDDLICDSDDERSSQKILSLKRKPSNCGEPLNSEGPDVKKVKFDDTSVTVSNLRRKTTPHLTRPNQVKKEILEKKIESGTLNENYVKINMKKKVFVRGKKNFNFSKHKKSEWKKKKKELHAGGEIGGVLRCFKCGDIGHYSRSCQSTKEDRLLPLDDMVDDCELPSLQEAEAFAKDIGLTFPASKSSLVKIPEPVDDPADIADMPDLEGVPQPVPFTPVPPLYSSQQAIYDALKQFGHDSFKPGQEEAIVRILAGKSTLLMLSTGGGKSLCYQLPAFLYHRAYNSIALVVSPLVSLMDDQVAGCLPFLKIGCLHANQTEKQRANVVAQIDSGELSALLVSPEAVVSCDSFGFGSVLKKLPPIAFACIDEVHCVSQWSYNFRPSYLMLTKVLKERLRVKTILGLTATASKLTVESVKKELGITDEAGVIQDTPLPSHLHLSVSLVEDKDASLLKLLKECNGGAALVYCTRREECVRLATLIRTVMREVTAQPYHAGLVASRRKSVQKSFMSGKLQVVVATVAFGMGINKPDIRCVLHYNMPKDWESYVQEVGRAGRDGEPAKCHLLLRPDGSDLVELRRHIHSNAVDRHILRKLLSRIFIPCNCDSGSCNGHEVAFSVAETVEELDLPEENISTLLCYLEFHEDHLVEMLTPAYVMCKISSYHGGRGLRLAARHCPPLAVAAAQAEDGPTASTLAFDVIKLARQIGWNSGTVKRYLKQTEWEKDSSGKWRRTGMNVTFSELAFRVRSRGDLSSEQLDEALAYLMARVDNQQKKALSLLQSAFSTFNYFATDIDAHSEESKSDEMKAAIRNYFQTDRIPDHIPLLQMQQKEFDEDLVAADVRHLVLTYRDNTFNGKAVARIMHGIQSPNYPASVWFRARQWRAHLDKPFEKLQQIATREILRLK